MYQRLFVTILFIGLMLTSANGSGERSIPFVDGRWSGGIETGSDGIGLAECWARTRFSDGTSFTLTKRSDRNWYLQLSNPSWRLPPSVRYTVVAQVDFYPQLQIAAEAKSQTGLEIANLGQSSLLDHIENGHTIVLISDSFNIKYDLEGSAKVIERVRKCFAD